MLSIKRKFISIFLLFMLVFTIPAGVSRAGAALPSGDARPLGELKPADFSSLAASSGNDSLQIYGSVTAISDNLLTVSGDPILGTVDLIITPETVIVGEPQVGDFVYAEAQLEPSGALIALFVEALEGGNPYTAIYGTVAAISETQLTLIVIGDPGYGDPITHALDIVITLETVIVGDPQVGDFVYVEVQAEPDGAPTALYIEALDGGGNIVIPFYGIVTAISDTLLTVAVDPWGDPGGVTETLDIVIMPDTTIVGEPEIDDFVYVEARAEPDGLLVALYIEVLDNGGGLTMPLFGFVEAISETQLRLSIAPGGDPGSGITGTLDIAITPETVIVGDPQVGDFVYVEAQIEADGSLTAIFISGENGGCIVSFTGSIVAISETQLSINIFENPIGGDPITRTVDIAITPETVFAGEPQVGDYVYVEAQITPDGLAVASFIEVLDYGSIAVPVIGFIEALSATQLTVAITPMGDPGHGDPITQSVDIAIIPETVIVGEPQVGDFVYVQAQMDPDGFLVALYIEVLDNGGSITIPLFGIVEVVSETQLTLSIAPLGDPGHGDPIARMVVIAITPETVFVGNPQVGDFVYVEAQAEPDGLFTALSIEVLDSGGNVTVPFLGFIQAISDTQLILSASSVGDPWGGSAGTLTIAINPETVIVGDPQVGNLIYGEAQTELDGSLTALYIEVLEGGGNISMPVYGFVETISEAMLTLSASPLDDPGGVITQTLDIAITPETVIVGEPQVGDFVYVDAQMQPDGSLTALYIEVLDGGGNISMPVYGFVETISDAMLTLSAFPLNDPGGAITQTLEIAITPETVIVGEPQVGDFVYAEAQMQPDGSLTALYIEVLDGGGSAIISIYGVVETISDTLLTVSLLDMPISCTLVIAITPETAIIGGPQAGDFVYVEAQMGENGDLVALYIEALECGGNVTVPLFGMVNSVSESLLTLTVEGEPYSGTVELAITPETIIIGEPEVGDFVYVEAWAEPDGALTAFYIEVFEDRIVGILEEINGNTLMVNGQQLVFSERTELVGSIAVNTTVAIRATVAPDGTVIARYIEAVVMSVRIFLPLTRMP